MPNVGPVAVRVGEASMGLGRLGWGLLCALVIGDAGASVPAELMDALQLRGDPRRGAALFDTCAACHGADGGGVADGTVPAIAGQPVQVVAKQLVDFRREQRRDLRMQHFADERHLENPQDIADVAAHVAGLAARGLPGHGPGRGLEAAAVLYRDRCESCHGAGALADGARMLPALAGQHAPYTARQLAEAAAGRRPGLQPAHRQALQGVSSGEIEALADFLSRLPVQVDPAR